MPGDLVPRQQWEQHAASLVEEYAGYVDARDLSPEDKLIALASIVPMALQVIEEARDTIERLNEENALLRAERDAAGIEDAEVA